MNDTRRASSSAEPGQPEVDRGTRQVVTSMRLLAALREVGLTHIVSSPGSRSTPLVLAALESELDLHSVVDERSAGFFALGIGRAGGFAALTCTSGTAVAHYLPAVVEARAARIPLLVLSADRPLDRLDCGAPQTIDQNPLLAGATKASFELGSLAVEGRALRALLRRVVGGAELALGEAGPVHFNLRFEKPLEPQLSGGTDLSGWLAAANQELRTAGQSTAQSAAERAPEGPAAASDSPASRVEHGMPAVEAGTISWHRAQRAVSPEAVELLAQELSSARRPLIVIGPAPPQGVRAFGPLFALATREAWPVCADVASQLRVGSLPDAASEAVSCDVLLEALCAPEFVERSRPDVVLQLGAPPVATVWERAIGAWSTRSSGEPTRHLVVAPFRLDPVSSCHLFVEADPALALAALNELMRQRNDAGEALSARQRWLRSLRELDRRLVAVIDDEAGQWSDGPVVRQVIAKTVSDTGSAEESGAALIWLGNSLPIRVANTFALRGGELRASIAVQRGVNGIDGNLSGFAGMVVQSRPRRAVALVGDVTLQHDLTGLALVREAARSTGAAITVAVLHNGGGRIFEQLPLATRGLDEHQWRHWSTPSPETFADVASHFELEFDRVGDRAQLAEALEAGDAARGSARLVEIVLPPLAAAEQASRLRARAQAEVSAWLESGGVERAPHE